MFSILNNLAKAAVNTVTLPIAVAADIVTMGGELSDKGSSYTGEKLSNIMKNLDDAGK